jgi:hypothetical protein
MNLYWSKGQKGKNATATFDEIKKMALDPKPAVSTRTSALGYLFYNRQLQSQLGT